MDGMLFVSVGMGVDVDKAKGVGVTAGFIVCLDEMMLVVV